VEETIDRPTVPLRKHQIPLHRTFLRK